MQSDLIPAETGDMAQMNAHRESGLTTSAPSPEIIAADVLNDAPGESFLVWFEVLGEIGKRRCEFWSSGRVTRDRGDGAEV